MKNNISILVINGPNLNLTGTREPQIYGSVTLVDINRSLTDAAASLGITIKFFQSNHEGDLIDRIHSARPEFDGIILNAGAFLCTARCDCLGCRSYGRGPYVKRGRKRGFQAHFGHRSRVHRFGVGVRQLQLPPCAGCAYREIQERLIWEDSL